MVQQLQTTVNERTGHVGTVASRVDELSGEAVNVRSRLEGLERRVGMEGQQHETALGELRATLERCVAEVGVLCQSSNEYQADIQARDTELFEMKELIFKLAVDIDYCREDIKTAQNTPEGVAVNVLDQKEQMKALRHELDESRKQLETCKRRSSKIGSDRCVVYKKRLQLLR